LSRKLDNSPLGVITAYLSSVCRSAIAVWRSTPVSSADRVGTTNRSICARSNFLIADSSRTSFFRRIGYETIDKGAQQDEFGDRKPRGRYKRETTCRRIEHPIWDLVGTAMRLADQKMVDTIMLVVADHKYSLADQWMKRIGDLRFERQKPGIMSPARMAEPFIGRLP
jgi:hypothetical protein